MKFNKFSYFLIFFSVVFFDRITKWFAVNNVEHGPLNIFPGFSINLTVNRGISWGMFHGASNLGFYLLAACVATVIACFLAYTVMEYKQGNSIGLQLIVLAGACSNFFDRIWYHGVIDFIDFYCSAWHWPSFNIADVAIIVGILLIMGRMFLWTPIKTQN
jgi:signal peptidase II